MIDTREELIGALYEAAELEHGVMLQYLFAALSLKKHLDEDITGTQQELIRTWESQILTVAREEMAHLGQVCNLLTAVGGTPRFSRPNFPQPAKEYYPLNFSLTRFSDESLYRFIRFELPQGEPLPSPPREVDDLTGDLELLAIAPDPLEYEYIGQLYGQIREAFGSLPEDELFIGPRFAQDTEYWSRRMQIFRVVDRETADKAIDFIVEEGEGAPGKREGSHYDTFLKMRASLAAQPEFEPARPVVPNPRTRPHRDAPYPGTLIEHEPAREIAELFNACYVITLLMLLQLYSYGGESFGERAALREASRQLMTEALRPIAEILTELPAKEDASLGAAGPSFELYSPLQLSTQLSNRWTLLDERYDAAVEEAARLTTIRSQLAFISENIRLIHSNIVGARAAEEQL